jgi:protein SCO1/2
LLGGLATLASSGLAAVAGGSADNLWSLGGEWQSDGGNTQVLSTLAGEPVILAMFYTGCHVTCPVTVEAMQWVEHNLPPGVAGRCRFVLVTLDPGGDTPSELRAFRLEHGLSAQWSLLRTSRRGTRALAERLGVEFDVGPYRTSHTSTLVVLDANGRIVARHTHLYPELQRLVAEVEELKP